MTAFRKALATGAVLVAAVVAACGLSGRVDQDPGTAPSLAGAPGEAPALARGRYLATAADCVACHTARGGKPFAGGLAFSLPFGTLYAPNITADRATGIGTWSDEQFVRAMHDGVGADGQILYPAFPYTSYTRLSRTDVLAIKAYLASLPPVRQANRAPDLVFPFNQRWAMRVWAAAFFRNERFHPDPARSARWNRGAYLAVALGHCGECHTPRNAAFAIERGSEMAGAEVDGWRAPDLTPDPRHGLGAWTDDQIADYLMTGHAGGHGSAGGPMAEVVERSLQSLAREDIDALVVYLRGLPARASRDPVAIDRTPAAMLASSALAPAPGAAPANALGLRLFASACASCHQWDGPGRQGAHASLVGARSVNDPHGANVTQMILEGVDAHLQGTAVFMPSFAGAYSDTEIAALANFVIGQYGGRKGLVMPQDVAARRARLR